MASNWKKYKTLAPDERRLFREALWKIYYCKLLLIFLSFKKLSHRFKYDGDESAEVDHILVKKIQEAILRSNKLHNWKNVCLVNTLTARWMMNIRSNPSVAYLGVRKNEKGSIEAHAWITSGGIEIVARGTDYTELHRF
ncbi:MAG: lasso peptide biosynthesis B2 protein [Crocinitomicaceae bacterium]|nr:lasso peptide biosynthesis B2 protein [Crocinitomicaceae bacterium]